MPQVMSEIFGIPGRKSDAPQKRSSAAKWGHDRNFGASHFFHSCQRCGLLVEAETSVQMSVERQSQETGYQCECSSLRGFFIAYE